MAELSFAVQRLFVPTLIRSKQHFSPSSSSTPRVAARVVRDAKKLSLPSARGISGTCGGPVVAKDRTARKSQRRSEQETVVARDNLQQLETKLMYKFRDKRIAAEAMIHSSCGGMIVLETESGREPLPGVTDNERLEWLGDKCFDLAVAQFLFTLEPGNEGNLTKLAQSLVSRDNANRLCVQLGLDHHLICAPDLQAQDKAGVIPSRYGSTSNPSVVTGFLDFET
jgi:Ribonuclease III domain